MPTRTWDAKTTALIVREALKGPPVAEVCTEPQRHPSPYYQWRDQFLTYAAQAFEAHQHTRQEARLGPEKARLKRPVGALRREVKTRAEWLS